MGWTFVYMFVVLKIPVVAAIAIVWWAVKSEPAPAGGGEPDEGGDGTPDRPRGPAGPKRRRGHDHGSAPRTRRRVSVPS